MPTERRVQRMREVLRHRQRDLTVVCENIHDPHNVSAILRTCDATGIAEVNLLYTNEPFPELGKKSSASAKKWLEIKKHRDYGQLRDYLKQQGMRIYATFLSPGAKSIYEIDWTQPAAILMGNEHRGVSDEALQICDESIYIPMFGMVESLNVSVATAVILYEACRQRMGKNMYPFAREKDKWVEEKLTEWLNREQPSTPNFKPNGENNQ